MPLNIDFIKYLLKWSNKAPEHGPFLILANMKMCVSLVIDTALGLVYTSVTGAPSRREQVPSPGGRQWSRLWLLVCILTPCA